MSRPARNEHETNSEITRLAQTLLDGGSLEVVRALAQAYSRIDDPAIRAGLLAAFEGVEDQPGLDQIWAAWVESRDVALGSWLTTTGVRQSSRFHTSAQPIVAG